MIIELKNIPMPSEDIINAAYRIANSAPLELELKAMHDKIQDYKKNSVSRKFVEDDMELNYLAKKEFENFFEEDFKAAVGVIKNIREEEFQYACWPPHADRVRIFALNFYIKDGGKDVKTVMYTTHGDFKSGPGTGNVFKYEDLTVDKEYHLEINKWYALSVRQAHSIENIENTRIIFTLSFFNLTFHDFVKKYPHLLT
jgi:hypothetical protein